MQHTRRGYVYKLAGVVSLGAATALAGCSSSSPFPDPDDTPPGISTESVDLGVIFERTVGFALEHSFSHQITESSGDEEAEDTTMRAQVHVPQERAWEFANVVELPGRIERYYNGERTYRYYSIGGVETGDDSFDDFVNLVVSGPGGHERVVLEHAIAVLEYLGKVSIRPTWDSNGERYVLRLPEDAVEDGEALFHDLLSLEMGRDGYLRRLVDVSETSELTVQFEPNQPNIETPEWMEEEST